MDAVDAMPRWLRNLSSLAVIRYKAREAPITRDEGRRLSAINFIIDFTQLQSHQLRHDA